MKFTVIGSGAIGGMIGAHLARKGNDVTFVDVDAAHVAAINESGLRITGPVEEFTVRAPAILPEQLPEVIDGVVIVAVKSHHTYGVADQLRGRLADDAYVLSIQNGLTADILLPAVGEGRLVVCFINIGADYMAPGEVMQGNVGTFRIGELDGTISERVIALAAELPYVEITDNIVGYLWGKEAYGSMLFAGAVSDLSIADTLDLPEYRPLMLAIAREVLAQSPVTPMGFDGFDPDDLEGSLDRLAAFNRGSAKSHSGIYRDLAVRKRPTEVAVQIDPLAGPLTKYVADLIRAIERGERVNEVANLDLLAAYERLERLGRPLNAVVAPLSAPKRALKGPLVGTAVAVKDIIDVAGSPRGNGNPIDMRGEPAVTDAPVIAALRQAGADVFALASLLEYAAGAPHPDLPEARNPLDPATTAGGSSGGSAALVAAGVCSVALGTDTGGSIRIPAAYVGVVGFKPSWGLLSVEGVTPLAPSLDHVGVLAADVHEAERVMAAISDLRPVAAREQLRLGVLRGQLDDPRLDPEIARLTQKALDRLAAAGVVLEERDSTPLSATDEVFGPIIHAEASAVHAERLAADPEHYGEATRRLLTAAVAQPREVGEGAAAARAAIVAEALSLAEGVDALVGPVVPYAAPALTPPMDTPEGEIEGIFTAPYNVTGQPSITIPCGVTAAGMPIAIQLAAPLGADAELLAVAARIEALLA